MVRRTSFYDLTLAVLLAAGAQAVILIVMVFISRPVERLFDSPNPGHLSVHRNGQVVLKQPFGGFRDLSGRPLDDAEATRLLPKDDTGDPWLSPAWLANRLTQQQRLLRLKWDARLQEVPGDVRVNWFVVHSPTSHRQAYLMGFDAVTKDLLGYLGQKGFRTSLPPPDENFAMAGEPTTRLVAYASGGRTPAGLPVVVTKRSLPPGTIYLAADEAVWEIDLRTRAVRVLFESPSIESMGTVTDERGEPELLVRTATEVIAIDLDGRRRASWKIPADFQEYSFQWYDLADGNAFATVQRQQPGNANSFELLPLWLNRDGKVTRSEELAVRLGLPLDGRGTNLMLAVIVPSPLVFSYLAVLSTPAGEVSSGEQPDFPTALAHALADAWPALATLYLVSAALAWLAYRRHVRYALPGAGTWAVFVFVFGLPGWVAYRWHRRWPLVEACGECHRPAPRDREQCFACGQLFAPPPLMGTEVLVA